MPCRDLTSLAGDDVHQRSFTRAIGADDATQFTDADVQIQVVEGLETIETDADVFQREDGAVARVQPFADALSRATASRLVPASALGSRIGSSMNAGVGVVFIVRPSS